MPIVPDGPITSTPPKPDGPISSTPPQLSGIVPDGPVSATAPRADGPISSTPPSTPTPIATPHQYDPIIKNAVQGSKLDPNVLRAIGMQETGLGSGANFDAKTGLDRDGNPGHGLFQLDPASGATKADLDRAAKDPAFAAQRAAQMLKTNLQRTNGNLREALAMYNAGSPTSPQGLAYADSVISKMQNLDAPDYDPVIVQKIKHDAKVVQNNIKAGKPLSQALARTDTLKPLHELEVKGARAMDWFNHNRVEGVLDILGAPQRAVGGFEETAGEGLHGQEQLNAIMDMVFNPTEKNQARATAGPQTLINAFAKAHGHKGDVIPTHDEIDAFVRANTRIPQAMKPYIDSLLKTGEDLAQQTVSDPTMVGSLDRALMHVGGHAAGAVAKAVGTVANTMGIGKWFGHMSWMSQAQNLGTELFGVRNDLDKAGFTKEGKDARLAIESSAISDHAEMEKAARRAAASPDASEAHLVKLAHQHGTAMTSRQASLHPTRAGQVVSAPTRSFATRGGLTQHIADVRAMTPEDRKAHFTELHNEIRDNEIKRRTRDVVKANPHFIAGPAANHRAIVDNLKTKDTTGAHDLLDKASNLPVISQLRDLGKRSIQWNPIPHGLVNVGTLAYQAGGIPAVMRGFAHMLKPGSIDKTKLDRLRDIGGLDEYAREEWDPQSPMGKLVALYGRGAAATLERMEQGWRVGMLDEMDRKLGIHPPGSAQELLKGRMIASRIGDYRNKNAFVKMFGVLGGPFVMFRLGIVPQQFLKTLAENPERIVSQLRAESDIDTNKPDKTKQLRFGGPMGDMLNFARDPMDFLASPSTAGPIAEAYYIKNHYHGLLDAATQLGTAYVPAASLLTEAGKADRNEQSMSAPDMMAQFLLDTFLEIDQNVKESGKQIKAAARSAEKEISL